jgi:hypothetical protein
MTLQVDWQGERAGLDGQACVPGFCLEASWYGTPSAAASTHALVCMCTLWFDMYMCRLSLCYVS